MRGIERSFREAVYALVSRIPPGRVMTYGQIAACLGAPRAARVVGTALRFTPDPTIIPWWRVINQQGGISLRWPDDAVQLQEHLLTDEGIHFQNGVVDLERYRWWPDDADLDSVRSDPEHLDEINEAGVTKRGGSGRSC